MPTLIGLIVFPSFLYFIHQLTVIYFLHKLDLNQVPISFYSINCSYCNLLSCIDLHVVQRSKLFLTAGHLPAKKKKKTFKNKLAKIEIGKTFFWLVTLLFATLHIFFSFVAHYLCSVHCLSRQSTICTPPHPVNQTCS